MKHPVIDGILWVVGLLVVNRVFNTPGATVWIFGSFGVWFVGQTMKQRRKYREGEIRQATENGLHAAGMPQDYGICIWDDCPAHHVHGHPATALRRYSSFAVWQGLGAPED